MSNKNTSIFDVLIGLIPFFILIYLEPSRLYLYGTGLLLYILYLSVKPKFKYFWNRFVLNEVDEKNYVKISELTTSKTVTRRAKEGGYETLDFTMKFNPNIERFNLRLFAKVLDIIIYYILIYLSMKYIQKFDINILFVSFLFSILINPIIETLTGRTFGKLITGLQVVDEQAEYPYILKSYARNILPYYNLILWMIFYFPPFDNLYFHNEKTKTYTIYAKEKKKILRMLHK